MPLVIPEHERKAMANRLMVQPPKSQHDVAEFQRFMKETERVAGFPADVLLTLSSLELLADQGNLVAQDVFALECRRWGITFPKRFAP